MANSRREEKFTLPLPQFKQLEARLALTLQRDTAGGPGGLYRVRSLYFDTPHDDDYNDALKGAQTRKKIRLRVYPPAGKDIKLEYKFKQGADQRKTSIPVSRAQAFAMAAGDYGFIAAFPHPMAPAIYRELTARAYRPKILIAYLRQAYTAPGNDIRVTFDSNIQASPDCDRLFSKMVHSVPLTAEDTGILEIKYSGLSYTDVQNALRGLDVRPSTTGKYILGRTALR